LQRDLLARHPEDGPVEEDVLAARQLRVEAGPHFQQAPHAAVDLGTALRRCGDAGEDLEQRALPRSVPADDPDDLAFGDLERDVAERPERLKGYALTQATNRRGERAGRLLCG